MAKKDKYLNNEVTPTMLSKEYNISKKIWNWIFKYKTKEYNLIDNRQEFSGNKKEENIDIDIEG